MKAAIWSLWAAATFARVRPIAAGPVPVYSINPTASESEEASLVHWSPDKATVTGRSEHIGSQVSALWKSDLGLSRPEKRVMPDDPNRALPYDPFKYHATGFDGMHLLAMMLCDAKSAQRQWDLQWSDPPEGRDPQPSSELQRSIVNRRFYVLRNEWKQTGYDRQHRWVSQGFYDAYMKLVGNSHIEVHAFSTYTVPNPGGNEYDIITNCRDGVIILQYASSFQPYTANSHILQDAVMSEWVYQHTPEAFEETWKGKISSAATLAASLHHLNYVIVLNVDAAPHTLTAVSGCLMEKGFEYGHIEQYPGTQWNAGEKCYDILLGLEHNWWIAQMLAAHKAEGQAGLGIQSLTWVRVFTVDPPTAEVHRITFLWKVVDRTDSMMQKAKSTHRNSMDYSPYVGGYGLPAYKDTDASGSPGSSAGGGIQRPSVRRSVLASSSRSCTVCLAGLISSSSRVTPNLGDTHNSLHAPPDTNVSHLNETANESNTTLTRRILPTALGSWDTSAIRSEGPALLQMMLSDFAQAQTMWAQAGYAGQLQRPLDNFSPTTLPAGLTLLNPTQADIDMFLSQDFQRFYTQIVPPSPLAGRRTPEFFRNYQISAGNHVGAGASRQMTEPRTTGTYKIITNNPDGVIILQVTSIPNVGRRPTAGGISAKAIHLGRSGWERVEVSALQKSVGAILGRLPVFI